MFKSSTTMQPTGEGGSESRDERSESQKVLFANPVSRHFTPRLRTPPSLISAFPHRRMNLSSGQSPNKGYAESFSDATDMIYMAHAKAAMDIGEKCGLTHVYFVANRLVSGAMETNHMSSFRRMSERGGRIGTIFGNMFELGTPRKTIQSIGGGGRNTIIKPSKAGSRQTKVKFDGSGAATPNGSVRKKSEEINLFLSSSITLKTGRGTSLPGSLLIEEEGDITREKSDFRFEEGEDEESRDKMAQALTSTSRSGRQARQTATGSRAFAMKKRSDTIAKIQQGKGGAQVPDLATILTSTNSVKKRQTKAGRTTNKGRAKSGLRPGMGNSPNRVIGIGSGEGAVMASESVSMNIAQRKSQIMSHRQSKPLRPEGMQGGGLGKRALSVKDQMYEAANTIGGGFQTR